MLIVNVSYSEFLLYNTKKSSHMWQYFLRLLYCMSIQYIHIDIPSVTLISRYWPLITPFCQPRLTTDKYANHAPKVTYTHFSKKTWLLEKRSSSSYEVRLLAQQNSTLKCQRLNANSQSRLCASGLNTQVTSSKLNPFTLIWFHIRH